MKVLAIIHAPVFSGPHNTMTVVAPLLAQQGIELTVVLPDEGQSAAARIRQAGVEVVTMPLHRMRAVPDPRLQLSWLSHLRREVDQLVALIHEQNFEAVITHTLPNLHGGLAARKADVACVWEIIDTFPPEWFRRAWMPGVLRLSDVVMTTGHKVGLAHPGVERLGERWVEYYPCVDVDRFRADPAIRKDARAELGFDDDELVIGNVAAISPMKGHLTFVAAAAQVRRTHPRTRFAILGSTHEGKDAYYDKLWSEAERLGLRVGTDLIVQDPTTRVRELIQALDVFWVTSEPRSEGLPTVIGEAKSVGLPVVATDVGSTAEAVTEGVSGFVCPPRDPAAIAAATRRLLDDPELRTSMGDAGRAEAEQTYAAQRGAEQHRIAIERAVRHHAANRGTRRKSFLRPGKS